MNLIDVAKLRREAAELSLVIRRFGEERGWPPEQLAQCLLSLAYGWCRKAGMNRDSALQRAGEQFRAVDREAEKARGSALFVP